MKSRIRKIFLTAVTVSFLAVGCKGGFNLFTVADDQAFGAQVDQEIESDPQQFPILDRNRYSGAYAYLDAMRDEILKSPDVRFKEEFAWELHIIHDDETLNAFATPGGYIYVYTGLIKFLNSADALAGVMGHEIAHSDRRHSTNQMSKQYGTSMLMEIALGENAGMLKEMTGALIGLKFSRSDETDADEHSVKYLCGSKYRADGAADFFEMINEAGGSRPPEFLSTHPNPENRVENIQTQAAQLSCGAKINKGTSDPEYEKFKSMLPK